MAKIPSDIEQFARQVGECDSPYATLAIKAAKHAAAGVLVAGDAELVLRRFREERQQAAGLSKSSLSSTDTDSGAVQVSKFRKPIEVGERLHERGVAMLEQAVAIWKELYLLPDVNLRHRGVYDGLIDVARKAMKDGRVLNDAAIMEVLIKQ